MKQAILVINAGSSSIKFAIFITGRSEQSLEVVYRGMIEDIGQQALFRVKRPSDRTQSENYFIDKNVIVNNHHDALMILLEWVKDRESELHIVATGHRVVHGGELFSEPVIVDTGVLTQIENLIPLAPLHQAHNLDAIQFLRHSRPEWMQVACFDTSFHCTMPEVEQRFALPLDLTKQGVRRYGFHGLSYNYIASVLPDYLGLSARARVIVAHLGHGVSMCAMKDRKSVATTMSFTPLDGLPMGTRCGSIDPAVILYLMQEKGMDIHAVSDLLHYKSGLLGLSGISSDVRELLKSDSQEASDAIKLFTYRISRELGSLAAALGGLDALVFTAGIGEHSALIREQICRQSAWLGLHVDEAANVADGPRISTEDSSVSTWVIPTNEELIIAEHTVRIVGTNPYCG